VESKSKYKMNLTLRSRIQKFSQIIELTKITNAQGVENNLEVEISSLQERLLQLKNDHQNLFIVGNGGSAGVAAHAVTDFFNVAKIRATTLHESSLLTCMANDFGYENAVGRMLAQLLNPGDVVIAISSSGNSMNMRNAATIASEKGAYVVTLTGFSANNPLRHLGHINIWLNSDDYGFVEVGHQFILHNIADRFNEKLLD
jgi:D-sedoheptulose 7-phosphate isomerase